MDTFTKEQLSDLKRPELQKICKEHGIKGGNQKKDILVELILTFYQQQSQPSKPSQVVEEEALNVPEEVVEVDVRPEEPEQPSTEPASRGRSASSRQPPAPAARSASSASTRKPGPSSSKVTTTARGGKKAGKGKDIVVIDEEEDGEDVAMPEELVDGQDDRPSPPPEALSEPLQSTDLSPHLLQESGPSSSSSKRASAPPPPPPSQPIASSSTSSQTSAIAAQVKFLISSLPTQAQYSLLSTQLASLSSSFATLSDLPAQVGALPTRAELEVLRREMLEGGWVRKEEVEAIVEERMSKVERRLAALEAGARSTSIFDPPSTSTAQHHSRGPSSSTSALGKHPRSPSVTFAPPPPPSAFGARQPSAGAGSGTPASSSAYGTLGLGFGLPGSSTGGAAGPSSHKKMRVVSGQSEMDVGLVDSMLDEDPNEGGEQEGDDEDPDRTKEDTRDPSSPPFISRSRSGTPRADPLLTPPQRASPSLPDNSFTPAPGPSASKPAPPSSSHHLHQHHHPFDSTAGGSTSGYPHPSPFAPPHHPNNSPQKNLPISALPFPIFATSPRPPVIAPASPTLSVGWDSPRKTSGGAGPGQMSMSSASSTGGLTPGRALFTSATGPGGETPKAHGGRGTPMKRVASSTGGGGPLMFGGIPGSGATLQGLVNAGGPSGGGGGLFATSDSTGSSSSHGGGPSSSASSSHSIFGAPLPLPPSIITANAAASGSSSKPSSSNSNSNNSPFLAPVSSSSSSTLLPPLPLNAPLSLSPAYSHVVPSQGSSNALPFPFPISPHPHTLANNPRQRAIQRGDLTGRMPPPPTPPAQRTLFGTEREVDGRFGDDDS